MGCVRCDRRERERVLIPIPRTTSGVWAACRRQVEPRHDQSAIRFTTSSGESLMIRRDPRPAGRSCRPPPSCREGTSTAASRTPCRQTTTGKSWIFPVCTRVATLEYFIHGSIAAGHRDECVRVFHQHHLADEEVPERQPVIEVAVGLLLARQPDIAADRVAAGFFGARDWPPP